MLLYYKILKYNTIMSSQTGELFENKFINKICEENLSLKLVQFQILKLLS